MIKPPFTVLILKNSNQPVTIRITTGLLLMTCGVITLFGIFIGFLTGYYVFNNSGDYVVAVKDKLESNYLPVVQKNNHTADKIKIKSLSVKHLKNDKTELTLSFSGTPDSEEVYVWLIVNPEAETAGEIVVYPRNPIFKGLPVDYRNGIAHFPSENSEMTISLSDETAGIVLEQFRIIVYSMNGKIIADRNFIENSNFGNSNFQMSKTRIL